MWEDTSTQGMIWCTLLSSFIYLSMRFCPPFHVCILIFSWVDLSRYNILWVIYNFWEGRSLFVCVLCVGIKWRKWRRSLVWQLEKTACKDNCCERRKHQYLTFLCLCNCMQECSSRIESIHLSSCLSWIQRIISKGGSPFQRGDLSTTKMANRLGKSHCWSLLS